MQKVSTHIWAPMPGRSTLFAAAYGHRGVSEAVGIDPHDAHLEPVRQVKTPGRGRAGDRKLERRRGRYLRGDRAVAERENTDLPIAQLQGLP